MKARDCPASSCCLMELDLDKCRDLKSTVIVSRFPVRTWFDLFQEDTYADACLTRITDKHQIGKKTNSSAVQEFLRKETVANYFFANEPCFLAQFVIGESTSNLDGLPPPAFRINVVGCVARVPESFCDSSLCAFLEWLKMLLTDVNIQRLGNKYAHRVFCTLHEKGKKARFFAKIRR